MSARHTTPTLLRRLVALACLGAVGVLVLSPAASAAEPTSTTLVKGTDFDDDGLARRIAGAESEYRLANENVTVLSEHSARLTAAAEEATAEAERLYAEVRDEEGGGIVSSVSRFFTTESDLDRAGAAADDAERARDLAELAADAVAAGIVRSEQARLAWETELAKASHLSAKQAAQLAAQTAARQSRFRRSYRADSKAEDALNHRALDRWLAYLDSLADAAIVPPNAQALRGMRLGSAGGFEVVRDATGRAVPGVAELDEPGQESVRVLPAETIRAVSEAFSRVGLPDGAAATGPVAYTCGGLLASRGAPPARRSPPTRSRSGASCTSFPSGSSRWATSSCSAAGSPASPAPVCTSGTTWSSPRKRRPATSPYAASRRASCTALAGPP